MQEGVDRRQVLLGGALAAQFALSGCVLPIWESVDPETGRPVVDFTFRRAEDQVELRFRFLNGRVSDRLFHNLSIAKVAVDQPLIVQIIFPPQYVLEEAFFESLSGGDKLIEPPVKAELSGESRLVFEIADLPHGHLPLSPEGLLHWTGWKPRVVPPVVRERDLREPGPLESAIETPTRMFISVGPDDKWVSSSSPRLANGRTELWGARAVGAQGGKPKAAAIWTRDETSNPPGFLTTLLPKQRRTLVKLTHLAEYRPEPMEPDLLMLTAFGSWFNVEKSWSVEGIKQGVVAYRHRGAEGRVNFEQVEVPALLFPLGFYVSLVITNERKRQDSPSGNPTGYDRLRLNIKFNEEVRNYTSWDFPFTAIEAQEAVSPPLDRPNLIAGKDYTAGAFWVEVAGKPYTFPFDGTDYDKASTPFTMPMICIADPENFLTPAILAQLSAEYDAIANYERRTRSFHAASVALAPSSTVGKTAVSVDAIEFGSRSGNRPELPFRGFEPTAQHINAALLAASANKAVDPGTFAWFDPYDPKAPRNDNQVFLQATPGRKSIRLSYKSHTADSGGFLAPTYDVAGVSAISGAYGGGQTRTAAGDLFAQGSFEPSDFFPDDASFLGGIKMSWILKGVSGLAGDQVPSILSGLLDYSESEPALRYSFTWSTDKIQSSPQFGALDPVFLAGDDTLLNVVGEGVMPLDNPEDSYAAFSASLTNFTLQLVYAGNGIQLNIPSVSFDTSTNEKGKFAVTIGDYKFKGQMLEFVEELAAELGLFGDDSPVDFTPSGVTIHLPSIDIPPIVVGALNIYNLSIRSGLRLPFNGDPLEFSFSLSSPQDMFAVTVGIYGGAGYFLIVLDAFGLKQIDASFSFGAFGELNLAGGAIKGSASLLGGFSYSSIRYQGTADHGPTTDLDYSAFVHAGGSASLLGLITIGIDFHIGLEFQQHDGASRLFGYCEVTYSVKVLFFSKSVTAHFEREFSRSGGGPKLLAASLSDPDEDPPMSFEQWRAYRAAFVKLA